jgi:hypothetical protein
MLLLVKPKPPYWLLIGTGKLLLEGDAINIILAIKNSSLFLGWNFANVIADI